MLKYLHFFLTLSIKFEVYEQYQNNNFSIGLETVLLFYVVYESFQKIFIDQVPVVELANQMYQYS